MAAKKTDKNIVVTWKVTIPLWLYTGISHRNSKLHVTPSFVKHLPLNISELMQESGL